MTPTSVVFQLDFASRPKYSTVHMKCKVHGIRTESPPHKNCSHKVKGKIRSIMLAFLVLLVDPWTAVTNQFQYPPPCRRRHSYAEDAAEYYMYI